MQLKIRFEATRPDQQSFIGSTLQKEFRGSATSKNIFTIPKIEPGSLSDIVNKVTFLIIDLVSILSFTLKEDQQ